MKEKFDGLVEHLFKGHIVLAEAIEVLERSMIHRALEESGGNQCAASKRLGIHRNTLQRKMAQYQLGARKTRRKPVAAESRTRRKAATA